MMTCKNFSFLFNSQDDREFLMKNIDDLQYSRLISVYCTGLKNANL